MDIVFCDRCGEAGSALFREHPCQSMHLCASCAGVTRLRRIEQVSDRRLSLAERLTPGLVCAWFALMLAAILSGDGVTDVLVAAAITLHIWREVLR